jgi:hypothetical protein
MKKAKLREKEKENMRQFLAQTPQLGDSEEDEDETLNSEIKDFHLL